MMIMSYEAASVNFPFSAKNHHSFLSDVNVVTFFYESISIDIDDDYDAFYHIIYNRPSFVLPPSICVACCILLLRL